jgi:hypothetical protein
VAPYVQTIAHVKIEMTTVGEGLPPVRKGRCHDHQKGVVLCRSAILWDPVCVSTCLCLSGVDLHDASLPTSQPVASENGSSAARRVAIDATAKRNIESDLEDGGTRVNFPILHERATVAPSTRIREPNGATCLDAGMRMRFASLHPSIPTRLTLPIANCPTPAPNPEPSRPARVKFVVVPASMNTNYSIGTAQGRPRETRLARNEQVARR